jgi:type VI secretion system secreted protein Hcp
MFKDKRTAMVGTMVAAVFLSLLTFMAPGKALAVYDCFLWVDMIAGESTDDNHRQWIDIVSWSFGETLPAAATLAAGGASTARVAMQDFKFTMRTNKASPKLFLAGAAGQRIKEIRLEVCQPPPSRLKYLAIKLENVVVSSFVNLGNSGSSLSHPMEEISLSFSRIQITYTEIGADGKSKGNVLGGWDWVSNRAY